MPDRGRLRLCEECGAPNARMQVGDRVLCDRCADTYISARTGYPRLPDPPAPEEIVGPDGVSHVMSYRLFRSPAGVSATAEEEDPVDGGDGYEFRIFGSHDCSPTRLLSALRVKVRQEIGRLYLAPHPGGQGWHLRDDKIAGRLVWNDQEEPYNVVIDGRTLSWEELGRALELYEGSEFRLQILPPESLDDPGDK